MSRTAVVFPAGILGMIGDKGTFPQAAPWDLQHP